MITIIGRFRQSEDHMSWQDEELKRREQLSSEAARRAAEQEERRALISAKIRPFWEQLLVANEKLPTKLRFRPVYDDRTKYQLAGGAEMTLTSVGPEVGAIISLTESFGNSAHIAFDVVADRLYLVHFGTLNRFYSIDDTAVDLLLRNLCTHRQLSDGLRPGPSAGHFENYDKRCFIATVVYRRSDASEVIALRRFRDDTLLQSCMGRGLVRSYYRLSPSFADCLLRHPHLAIVIKVLLFAPLLAVLRARATRQSNKACK